MNNHGLTLSEVMVASLILVLTTACVLSVFTMEGGTVSAIGRRMQAMDYCRQTLEGLATTVGADTWPDSGNLSAGAHDHDLPAGDLNDNLGGLRNYVVTNVGGAVDYKSVTVTVQWNEPTQ